MNRNKLYINNIPKQCSAKQLHRYFKSLFTDFHLRKSKNKGAKSFPFAVITLSNSEDTKRLLAVSHIIMGKKLKFSLFIAKKDISAFALRKKTTSKTQKRIPKYEPKIISSEISKKKSLHQTQNTTNQMGGRIKNSNTKLFRGSTNSQSGSTYSETTIYKVLNLVDKISDKHRYLYRHPTMVVFRSSKWVSSRRLVISEYATKTLGL